MPNMTNAVITPDAKPFVGDQPVVHSEGINVSLLKKVMEYIKNHPQTWYQQDWVHHFDEVTNGWTPHLSIVQYEEVNSCSTAFCFAGHAAMMEGFPAPKVDDSWTRFVADPERGWLHDNGVRGYDEGPSEFAQARLGLKYDVADELFDASNTMQDLEDMVDYLIQCAEDGNDPDWSTMAEIRDDRVDYDDEDYDEEEEDVLVA